MLRTTTHVLAVIVTLAFAAGATAQPTPAPANAIPAAEAPHCAPPPAPPTEDMRPAPTAAKPAIPSCIDPQTMVGRCPPKTISSYNAAINAYNSRVMARAAAGQRYTEALNDWMRASRDYANCEITILNAEEEQR